MNSINKKFDYGVISVIDILKDSSALYKFIQNQKIICSTCKSFISIQYPDNNISIKCNCAIVRIYPPRDDRGGAYLVVKKNLTKKDDLNEK